MRKLFNLILLLCYPFLADATLGESAASIEQDNRALASVASLITTKQVSSHKLSNNKYNVSYIQSANNIMIKEFSAKDKVFAIAWSGERNPDLSQLLGSYFKQFKTSQATLPALTSRNIKDNDLVVTTYGVVGDFHGVAYVPSLMPVGITMHDLTK